MAQHVLRLGTIAAVTVAGLFLPYVPGRYDPLAAAWSSMARVIGWSALLLVPIGAVWLAFELSGHDVRRRLGLLSGVALAMAGAALAAAALTIGGVSFGVLTSVTVCYTVARIARVLRHPRPIERSHAHPAPIYLLGVPLTVAVCQFLFLDHATELSRRYVMDRADRLIADLEQYRSQHGVYPVSLQSVNEDYLPGVVGVSRFHYEPNGAAYNLYFEPSSSSIDTREIVMYNRLDEHVMTSHNIDLLQFNGRDLELRRGFYSMRDVSAPHWKSFLFD